MTTHTEGELKILVHVGPCVIGTDEREVAEFYADGEEQTAEDQENARRAIACWMACAGIPTDVVEGIATGQADHSVLVYRRLARDRDDLVELLRESHQMIATLDTGAATRLGNRIATLLTKHPLKEPANADG